MKGHGDRGVEALGLRALTLLYPHSHPRRSNSLCQGGSYTSNRIPCASAICPLQLMVLVWRLI